MLATRITDTLEDQRVMNCKIYPFHGNFVIALSPRYN